MNAINDALRAHLLKHAPKPGRHVSAFAPLYYFRTDEPIHMKAIANDLVVAFVAQRTKSLELASGRVLHYGPGSFLFVSRESVYSSSIARATSRRPYLSLGLKLDPEIVVETALAIEGGSGGTLLGSEDDHDDDAFVGQVDDALGETLMRLLDAASHPIERQVLAPLALRELVYRLLRSEAAVPLRRALSNDDTRIREVMRSVRDDPGQPLDVSTMAKQVAMSPSHFAHRFRAVARMTPMRFVKNARLSEARMRMVRDGLGAAEAAHQVGYASPSHFTRDFKAHYGAPPASYVREVRRRAEAQSA